MFFTDKKINLERNLTNNLKYTYKGEKVNQLGLYNIYAHVEREEGILKLSFVEWLNQQVKKGFLVYCR